MILIIDRWTYPYIPILSEELIKYLQTPLPFIMGIESDLYEVAKEYLNEEDDVFVVFFGKNIVIPYSLQEKNLNLKKLFKEKQISTFPEENENYISSKLNDLKKSIQQNPQAKYNMVKIMLN